MEGKHIEKMVEKIKFSLFSPEMVRKISSAKITVPDTYNEDGYPIDGGLVDQRMGVIDPGLKCKTCGGKIRSCPGHFAHIELVRPVVHPEFAKKIHGLLKASCFKCHRLLVPKKQIDEFVALMLNEEDVSAELLAGIKKASTCPHCGAKQAEVKFEKPTTFYEGDRQLLASEIRDYLAALSAGDLKQMGFDPRVCEAGVDGNHRAPRAAGYGEALNHAGDGREVRG